MLHLAILKLNCLLTFESFALIAAFFLIAYMKKQEMSKWLVYSSVAIAIFVFSLILCTSFNACYLKKCNENEGACNMEQGYNCYPSQMRGGAMGHCNKEMMGDDCKDGMGRGMMMEGCEHKEEGTCCDQMMKGKEHCSSMEKKVGECKTDSLSKKEMMKK